MASKQVPNSEKAEKFVLGQALLEPDLIVPQMKVRLKPDYFYQKKYRRLYKHILKTYEKHKTVDPILLKEIMDGDLALVGGVTGLTEIMDSVTTATEFEHFADLIEEYAFKRKMQELAWIIVDQTRDEEESINSITSTVNKRLREIVQQESTTVDGKVLIEAFDRSLKEMKDGNKRWEGVSWAWPKIEKEFGGFQKGTLSFLAGPTSIGKSLLVCNVVYRQVQRGIRPGYISIELPEEQIGQRMLQLETGLSKRDLYSATGEDFCVRAREMIKMYPWRFLFNESDLDRITFQIMKWAIRDEVDIVYLDYMQVVKVGNGFRDRLDRYSHIITTVKNLATRFDVPIVFLSQVSREVQKSGNYDIHSIKYVGDAENEADKVFFLRPRGEDYRRDNSKAKVTLVKGKDNQGKLGKIHLDINYKTQQVEVSR